MNLKLLRNRFLPERTIGQLYVDDEFFCFTLEDKVREVEGQKVEVWKVQDVTAIPQGRYKITIDFSEHFKKFMMHVNNVPGFGGVRIHSGNTEKDTEGCILLGYKLNPDGTISAGSTRPPVADLMDKVKAASGEVYISIINSK